MVVHVENQGAISLDDRSKHMRQLVKAGLLKLEYLPTKEMLADILTRATPVFGRSVLRFRTTDSFSVSWSLWSLSRVSLLCDSFFGHFSVLCYDLWFRFGLTHGLCSGAYAQLLLPGTENSVWEHCNELMAKLDAIQEIRCRRFEWQVVIQLKPDHHHHVKHHHHILLRTRQHKPLLS